MTPHDTPPRSLRLLKRLEHAFTAPHPEAPGIASFLDWKFWTVLLCYLGAMLVMARAPLFMVHYQWVISDIVPLLLAYVVTSSLCWELLLFGRPSGANLLLQLVMTGPMALLLSYMLSTQASVVAVGTSHWNDHLAAIAISGLDVLKKGVEALTQWLPRWLQSMFLHPWNSLLLLFVLLALSLRNKLLKLSVLATTLLVCIASALVCSPSRGHFLLALLLFAAGLALHWCRYDSIAYYTNVLSRIRTPQDARLLSVVLAVMERLKDNRTVTPLQLEGLVQEHYSPHGEYSLEDQRTIAMGICQKMVHIFNLVTTTTTCEGSTLRAVPSLHDANTILTCMTAFPRMATACLAGIAWCAMPLDLIPDYIPFIGLLDDMAVCTIATFVLKDGTRALSAPGTPPPPQ